MGRDESVANVGWGFFFSPFHFFFLSLSLSLGKLMYKEAIPCYNFINNLTQKFQDSSPFSTPIYFATLNSHST